MIIPFVDCLCLLSIPSQFSKPLPVLQQQQRPFCGSRSLCSTSPNRRSIQNIREDIKTKATKPYQVEEGKGLCHCRAQKEHGVSFGRKKVKLSWIGIPLPAHEWKMLSSFGELQEELWLLQSIPPSQFIFMWTLPFKVQSLCLKIVWGTVPSLCELSLFKKEWFKRQKVRGKQYE